MELYQLLCVLDRSFKVRVWGKVDYGRHYNPIASGSCLLLLSTLSSSDLHREVLSFEFDKSCLPMIRCGRSK